MKNRKVSTMVFARVNINGYSNKVLNVIKDKFDLNDKSEALNKFVELYGDEIVEKESKDEYVKKIIEICDEHLKKHPKRRMILEELDQYCGVS